MNMYICIFYLFGEYTPVSDLNLSSELNPALARLENCLTLQRNFSACVEASQTNLDPAGNHYDQSSKFYKIFKIRTPYSEL